MHDSVVSVILPWTGTENILSSSMLPSPVQALARDQSSLVQIKTSAGSKLSLPFRLLALFVSPRSCTEIQAAFFVPVPKP